MAKAVLLGSKTKASRRDSVPFTRWGLAHLFAVSGLHVGILMGLFSLPARALGLGPLASWVILLVILPFYAVLTGLPGSVVRAVSLVLLASGARSFGRRATSLHLVGLVFWSTSLLQPWQVLDSGVRLSYLAAGGIVTSLQVLPLPHTPSALGKALRTGFQVSLSAQWATLPQVASSFGRISSLAPLANLLAVPLFGLGVWVLVLGLAAHGVWPWLGESLASWAWLILRSLAGLLKAISSQWGTAGLGLASPNALTFGSWLVLTAVMIRVARTAKTGRAASSSKMILILGLMALSHGVLVYQGQRLFQGAGPRVWQFDVGQGDASFLRFPDGTSFFIDTAGLWGRNPKGSDGPMTRAILPYLNRGGINKIHSVILSHGHMDHTGGTYALEQALEVDQWITGGDSHQDIGDLIEPEKVAIPENWTRLYQWENWTLDLISPPRPGHGPWHENDHSLIALLCRQGRPHMVWSGDLEKKGEKATLESGVMPPGAQVWKAGHHGSNTSGTASWIRHLNPQLILISCGVGNKYGHPNHGYYTLGADTIATLRTDLDGSIELNWSPQGHLKWKTRHRSGEIPALP